MSGRFFLRSLAAVYLIAFWSLGTQILGLIGSQGILPVEDFLKSAARYWGPQHLWQAPTLCWICHSDGFLLFLCGAGIACSMVLFAGVLPCWNALVLWVLYLSLTTVGQDFLAFQWDNLLLEAGFLAIFIFSPRCLWARQQAPSRIIIWLLRCLLFKLMFESGMVKILSGDYTWVYLTALTYHYLTQPLPNMISWYFYQLPAWFHKSGCFIMLIIELFVPFLIFCGQRARRTAFFALCGLQILIILTGNYCFFNLLTLALCCTLLDDRLPRRSTLGQKLIGGAVAAVVLTVGIAQMAMIVRRPLPQPVYGLVRWVAPLRSINNYGLFAVMTTQRNEIIIEGSRDGITWLPYEFHWKPGDVDATPRWVMPHQPRLDWQMWFAALSDYQQNLWFVNMMARILQGSKPVIDLLQKDPFNGSPPQYIRAVFYEYHFTDFAARHKTKAWWRREYKGLYSPAISVSQN